MSDVTEKLQKVSAEARAIVDKAEAEKRDLSDSERSRLNELIQEGNTLNARKVQMDADADLRKTVAAMVGEPQSSAGDGSNGAKQTAKGSIGEVFVSAPAFKAWMAAFPNGEIPESVKRFSSPPIALPNLLTGRKTLITGGSDTSAGALISPDYTGIYEPLGRSPLVLRSLINIRPTQSDLVHFVRQTTQVAQAAAVPEANVTTYSGATGEVSGEKPEGAVAFEGVDEPVKTIAVWIPASKAALADAGQIRGIIDQELGDDIEEELENQILNGNGVSQNFTGILNTAGILTQVWNTDLITTTRQALTTLRTTGRAQPTAWVVNPSDMETIDLLQDAENRYYWGGPMREGPRTLWGVPVVECEAKAAGTALLGDWRKAILWDRMRATMSVSDQHNDFFIRNMVAFLCELRAAFGLIRPSAFIEVDMTNGS